jgi:asparagine synthetase B (glutamine-hydrolysing)
MLCSNNFVIIGVYEDIPSLVDKISKLTGLKVKEVILASAKIIVATKEECMLEKDNYILLLYGAFLNENISLIDKAINDLSAFIKNYSYQGVAVLFDSKNASIIVVGDPGPARTVFYLSGNDIFIISTDMSIVKAVANILGIDLRQDILTLFELIVLGSKVSRRTAYKDIKRLLPGEYIDIKIKNNKKRPFEITVEKYWDGIQSEMNNEINSVIFFMKTIHEQLTAFCQETGKSPIAVPVSGGLDSTYLLFVAKQAGCNQIIAPHLNLRSKQEEMLSKYVAVKANVPYLYFSLPYIDPNNYIQQLTKLLKLIGYPREGDSSLPYLLLAQKLKGVKFSLGGEASDPVFGGEDFYKYFAVQLIKQKRLKELWNLIKIVKKYNYHNESIVSIIVTIILTILKQILFSLYSIRYRHFLSVTHKYLKIENNALKKKIAQYFTELTRPFYEAPNQNYYRQIMTSILRYTTSHIAHARIKSDESQKIFTFLPFATRRALEASMNIPIELSFFPWGSRSMLRLFLKHMRLPPAIYLQRKSGFSMTHNVLRDSNILTYMKEVVSKCWASKYVRIDKLTPYQIHNFFNFCEYLDST